MPKHIAISTGPKTHLDHLAPLCHLLQIPLIVTEKSHLAATKMFYPMISVQYIPLSELTLEYIAKQFDGILTCGKFWAMQLKPLLKSLYNKDVRFVFCPHGNSDKESRLGPYNQTIEQDIALVYGAQMEKEKEGQNTLMTGNLRLWFYKKYKAHFGALANEKVFAKLDPKKKIVLYAPTWNTKDNPTSFFTCAETVIHALEKEHNLLIKLHPLLEENHPAHFHYILGKYEKKAHFLLDFPPIYPLLEKTDIYLGDFSSIGYDFLYFNRPMFFLKEGGELQQCGQVIDPRDSLEEQQKELSAVREKMYLEAFGKDCEVGKIKEKINALLS